MIMPRPTGLFNPQTFPVLGTGTGHSRTVNCFPFNKSTDLDPSFGPGTGTGHSRTVNCFPFNKSTDLDPSFGPGQSGTGTGHSRTVNCFPFNKSTDLDPSFGPGQSESSILMLSNISAHLHLKYFNDYKNAQRPYFPNGSVPLKFNSSLPTDYIKGLDLINNNIVVQSKGNYFVYSSIHILVLGSLPCRRHPQKIWKHMVKLTRAGEKATHDLLLAHHTCCDHCTRDRATSYTAGVFQLNSNDSLRVEINGHGLVSCDYETNCFFGLVKLNGDI
ncbi:hypothetical protein Btru_023609 [Bulinus truncatus]|nr:hypothetical protein Btru_023609 [Bulinus truncatus]